MSRKARVPHPGWACCDLEQDLAAWLRSQREKVAGLRAMAAELRAEGIKADAAALSAITSDAGWRVQMEAERARQHYHGEANGYAQRALIIEGHADRVEAAHTWRLK